MDILDLAKRCEGHGFSLQPATIQDYIEATYGVKVSSVQDLQRIEGVNVDDLTERLDRICRVMADLSEAEQEVKGLRNELEDLEAQMSSTMGSYNQQLADMKARAEEEQGKLDAAKQGVAQVAQEKDAVEREVAQLRQQKDDLAEELRQEKTALVELLGRRGSKDADDEWHQGTQASRLDVEALHSAFAQMGHPVPQHIVELAVMALRTDQILVLTGKPGTGKTTFARDLAEVLGAKLHYIAVQPSWTDAESLLGYYAMDKGFISTPFLEALLQARAEFIEHGQDARMHLVCLDEMNLARVEYYFATLLGLLQLPGDERWIGLLPPSKETEGDLARYADFLLPPNVRFVGTLNMDDTTYPLSRKVIDRSLFAVFKDPAREGEAHGDGAADPVAGSEADFNAQAYCPQRLFAAANLASASGPELAGAEGFIESVAGSWRMEKYYKQMWAAYRDSAPKAGSAPEAGEEANQQVEATARADQQGRQFLDLFMLSKVLPSFPEEDGDVDSSNYTAMAELGRLGVRWDDRSDQAQGVQPAQGAQLARAVYPHTAAHVRDMLDFADAYGAFTFFCER